MTDPFIACSYVGCRLGFQPDPWGFKKETYFNFTQRYDPFPTRSHAGHHVGIPSTTTASPST